MMRLWSSYAVFLLFATINCHDLGSVTINAPVVARTIVGYGFPIAALGPITSVIADITASRPFIVIWFTGTQLSTNVPFLLFARGSAVSLLDDGEPLPVLDIVPPMTGSARLPATIRSDLIYTWRKALKGQVAGKITLGVIPLFICVGRSIRFNDSDPVCLCSETGIVHSN